MLAEKEINKFDSKSKESNFKNKLLENNLEITILGDKTVDAISKAPEILPEWINNSIKVDNSLKNSKPIRETSNISKKLIKILKKSNFLSFFPVQHTVIPTIIESWSTINVFRPRDICVCAPTGSGKTLAYVIPILELLSRSPTTNGGPRAIVVVPVRDLAAQVFSVFEGLCPQMGIKCVLIAGHNNLDKERDALMDRADVVVCTPGRLVEHIKNTAELDLSEIRHLVIDEADRVLADPKHDWFLTLTRHMGRPVKSTRDIRSSFLGSGQTPMQKILLSATLTRQPHLLEHFDLYYPQLFVIGGSRPPGDVCDNYAAPDGLKEFFVLYSKEYSKIIFIVDQIRRLKLSHILCFVNTKETAVRLNQLLNQFAGVRSAHLHCEQAPETRHKLRQSLEKGSLDVLVTVDSMGRGMDIAGVSCVIQYDVQVDVCTYIHRVGRTARAGQTGLAYALVSSGQIFHLKKNLANCGRQIKNHKFATGKCFKYMTEYNLALSKLQSNNNPPIN